jgi:hypothetical protein
MPQLDSNSKLQVALLHRMHRRARRCWCCLLLGCRLLLRRWRGIPAQPQPPLAPAPIEDATLRIVAAQRLVAPALAPRRCVAALLPTPAPMQLGPLRRGRSGRILVRSGNRPQGTIARCSLAAVGARASRLPDDIRRGGCRGGKRGPTPGSSCTCRRMREGGRERGDRVA